MPSFEIYTKKVELTTSKGTETYQLRPLSGRFLPKLFSILQKFDLKVDQEIDAEELLKSFDEKTVTDLHELILETIKKSYPNEPQEGMDEFVTQNFLQLFPVIIEVNLNTRVGQPALAA